MKCSACGQELGPPSEEVKHPDDPDPPDDPHFVVQVRSDGAERAQCTNTGQLASVVKGNQKISPLTGEVTGSVGEGGGSDRDDENSEPPQEKQGGREGAVYDLPEEKDQIDILEDVVTNPHYELNDDQIAEVKDWATDYDGQMPPNVLESLLKNMKGVQKQTSELVRERYELKLNKWVREQSQEDTGPPIGAVSHQNGINPRPNRGDGRPNPTPQPQTQPENQKQQSEPSDAPEERKPVETGTDEKDLRRYRRESRTERRQKAADIAAEEMAKQAAPEVARELTQNFGTYFGLPAKIIESKIEKDPDWAFEVAERLDVDLFDLLEPSEARKEELKEENQQSQAAVDNELDDALDDITGASPDMGGQNTSTDAPNHSMPDERMEPPQEDDTEGDEDDVFEEMFGDEGNEEINNNEAI